MLNEIAEQLHNTGYIVLSKSLPAALLQALSGRCADNERARFLPAHVGRGEKKQQISAPRFL